MNQPASIRSISLTWAEDADAQVLPCSCCGNPTRGRGTANQEPEQPLCLDCALTRAFAPAMQAIAAAKRKDPAHASAKRNRRA